MLERLDARGADPARLAHHAEAAGDAAAVLRHAPVAGEHAARLGAHREAAAQYARALRWAGELPAREQAVLLEHRSYECYLTDQMVEAIEAREQALDCHRELGDGIAEGDDRRWLSRLHWFHGQNAEAERFAAEAVEQLEQLPPGPELAMAFSNRAQLAMLASDYRGRGSTGAGARSRSPSRSARRRSSSTRSTTSAPRRSRADAGTAARRSSAASRWRRPPATRSTSRAPTAT